MIPSAEATVQNVGTLTENVRMGIDQSAFAHIMSILTDLYSNPRLAVIREYSTNARDSPLTTMDISSATRGCKMMVRA